MTPGQRLAEQLVNMDWQRVVMDICAARRWRYATLARQAGSTEHHMRRLARAEVAEPASIKLAITLLDMRADI